ncbi:MAG: diadenylate cyclase CdaA [Bacillota bacterium]|jgi:diadenylate cyclase|nr:TIGR00159 family protein [Bacillota bacterium]
MLDKLQELLKPSPVVVIDIAIVLYLLYRLYILIRGTRAVQLLKGLVILVFANLLSQLIGLTVTNWLLEQILTVGIVALPIIFYPELRKALEHLGRGSFFTKPTFLTGDERIEAADELVTALVQLSARRIGALVVWEQETGLKDWSETGVNIDAVLTSELVLSIFEPSTPLHDGAVILRGNRVRAASCYLPLSDSPELKVGLGTRHRAGVGITEQSDAIAIIVSEETGAISLAHEGKLTRYLDEKSLRDWLENNLHRRPPDNLFRRMQFNGKD